MLWEKVDQRWNSRLDKSREGDVSWKVEQWPVPGESPLEVRVCTRDGVPVTKFASAKEAPRTSITLHLTCGYGNFTGLMGGSDHGGSAHILLGRCGTTYLLVPTEFTSWHATWWNPSSIGIEIDNIGGLRKQGDWMVSEYSLKDTYCKADEKEVFLEKQFAGYKYWATLTEKQYVGLGKLLKALCFKHKIPRIILPEEHRYDDFKKDEKIRRDFRGICTHVNIDPARRSDIGPYIDWPKVIHYGGLTEADCHHPPASVLDTWRNATGGSPVTGSGSASSSSSSAGGSGDAKPAASKPSSDTPPTKPRPAVGAETLPAPVMVDSHTLRVHIGSHGGRLCLSVKQPGDPLPTTPDVKSAPEAKAPGKRDEFIAACMNLLGAPYKAGSGKPAEGIDGAHLIGLGLRRVGVFKSDDEMPEDATHLSALWHVSGADPASPTEEIVPGDLAWFGKGDHDNDPTQHPMVYLGGGRVLGPVPDGAASSAVQVIAVEKVPEKFAGWMHIDDFGDEPPKHGDHPGDKPLPGEKLTSALLPPTPAAQYDALKAVVARTGGKWEDAKGKLNLVGVKSLNDRCLVSPRPGGWNDTLFAAFLDEDGHKCVLDLRASLNPGTDENPTETWQLWEGSWKFKLVQGDSTEGKALQPDGKVKGWFDGAGMGAPRPIDHEQEASAKDLQPAKPPQEEGKDKPPAAKPKPTPKDDKPAPPADKPFVFDGKSKKLSMKFGMRMMRALLEWELHEEGGQLAGVTYSHNGDCPKYKAPEGVVTEWPALDGLVRIKPPKQTAAGVSLWMAFGVQWGASGSTNCCNAQMAAIFVALQDGNMRIQKDGELLEVDVTKGTPHAPAIKDRPPDGKNPVGYSTVFESVWVQAGKSKYLDSKGKKLFGGYEYIAPAWAMKWLGVGDAVGKWGEEAALLKVRMGDNACWSSHNWLVGDIRYAVTLKGRKTPVYVDQSDLVRGDHPDPNAQDRERSGYKMTREDCLWVEQNEALFEARLQAFLDGKQMEFDGKDYEVTKIEAHAVRVFSSNCVSFTTREKQPRTFKTANGVVYEHKTSPPGTDEWVRDDERTKNNRLGLGVSRPWSKFADHVDKANGNCWGFARWFDNAGGAEWKDQGHG
ncbi:MAG TPA: N-acetylmuramoyl-L-alanine amidase [Myxococcales bacterium]|nr:N-acetylmuramoyl-L-alanine amidase [Myxococcales bacterium]